MAFGPALTIGELIHSYAKGKTVPITFHGMSKTLPVVMLAAYCCKARPASCKGTFA